MEMDAGTCLGHSIGIEHLVMAIPDQRIRGTLIGRIPDVWRKKSQIIAQDKDMGTGTPEYHHQIRLERCDTQKTDREVLLKATAIIPGKKWQVVDHTHYQSRISHRDLRHLDHLLGRGMIIEDTRNCRCRCQYQCKCPWHFLWSHNFSPYRWWIQRLCMLRSISSKPKLRDWKPCSLPSRPVNLLIYTIRIALHQDQHQGPFPHR